MADETTKTTDKTGADQSGGEGADKAKETDAATGAVAPEDMNAEQSMKAFDEAFEEFADQDDTTKEDPPDPAGGDDDEQKKLAGDSDDDVNGNRASQTDAQPGASADAPNTTDSNAEDIWANAPPKAKAAFEAATKRAEANEHELKSNRERVQALNRKLSEYETKGSPSAPDKEKPPGLTVDQLDKDPDWKAFTEEYPEVAGPVTKALKSLISENTNLRSQVDTINQDRTDQQISDEEKYLTEKHDDWVAVADSEDFGRWLAEQPLMVHQAFARNAQAIVDGREAAKIFDMFRMDNPADGGGQSNGGEGNGAEPPATNGKDTGLDASRKRKLASATAAEQTGTGQGSGPPNDDFDAAFDFFASR